jgi:hypothetical protein
MTTDNNGTPHPSTPEFVINGLHELGVTSFEELGGDHWITNELRDLRDRIKLFKELNDELDPDGTAGAETTG